MKVSLFLPYRKDLARYRCTFPSYLKNSFKRSVKKNQLGVKIGNALVTLLELQVFMGDGDRLPSSDPFA